VDDVSLLTLLLLVLAGLVAGWVDAVVGGGGLVQLPSLAIAFPGAAPVQLIATNQMVSFCGTSASAITLFRRVRPDVRTAVPLALWAFGGSAAGAALASHIPRAAFNPIILVVLLVVGAITVLRPELGAATALRWRGVRHHGVAGLCGFLIGVYNGTLGPGAGSFMVFALVGVLGYGFLEASAKAKIANLAFNIAALTVFIPQGAVAWEIAVPMGLANLVGGYLGARTAVAKGARFIRSVFVVVVGAFAVRIGADVVASW
jgi:uncharacterized protein